MKVLVFLIICLVEASRGDDDRKICDESTCGPGKCCMKGYYDNCAYCADFPDLGESCVQDMYDVFGRFRPLNIIFMGNCPCSPGLYCDKSTANHTCQKKNKEFCNQMVCETSEDCPEGECCVADFPNISPLYCAPFTEKGELCFSDMKSSSMSETFTGKCPCSPGFECVTFNGKESGDRDCYEIENPPERTNKTCDTGDDCSDSECCVLDYDARVRECRPLLKNGQKCDRDLYEENKPTVYDNKCPCGKPAECIFRCVE